jgi:D-alanyl-D-alanine carboxypeptidase
MSLVAFGRRLALTGLLGVAAASGVCAQTYDVERLRAALETRVKLIQRSSSIPGINAAFIMPDGKYIRACAGYADEAASKPLRLSDRMLSGSTGKMFFATVILQFVQQGRLDLDAPISRYVANEPWFAGLPNAQGLTLRNLLNHSSGIPEHVATAEFTSLIKADPDKVWGHAELLKTTQGKPALFKAGEGWSYADTNYIVAALVLEKVSGRPAYDLIQERIIGPLKLTGTSPSTSRTLEGLVQGIGMPNSPFHTGPLLTDGRLPFNPQMEWAGGGFVSTPLDLARLTRALCEGKLYNGELLKQATTGLAARTGRGHKYGLGFQIRPMRRGETWGHSGWFPGYQTDIHYFTEHKFTIAVQINTDDPRRIGRPISSLVDDLSDVVMGVDGLNRGR